MAKRKLKAASAVVDDDNDAVRSRNGKRRRRQGLDTVRYGARKQTCFFGLPSELRTQIYENVLDYVVAEPPHPYGPYAEGRSRNYRLRTYLSLLLSNRQIKNETSCLFQKEYARKLELWYCGPPAQLCYDWAIATLISMESCQAHGPRTGD